MAFTVEDFEDLMRLLRERPEWQAELRRLIVGEDLKALNESLLSFQRSTEASFARMNERMDRADERFERAQEEARLRFEAAEERLDRIDAILGRIAERQEAAEERLDRIDAILERIAERQDAADARFDRVEVRLDKLEAGVGRLRDSDLENRLRNRAPGYFGRQLHRLRVVAPADLPRVREAAHSGRISDAEWTSLMALDLLLHGVDDSGPVARERYLAIETSAVIDERDVERAADRSRVLRECGYDVAPWVAGERILASAEDAADARGVSVLIVEPAV